MSSSALSLTATPYPSFQLSFSEISATFESCCSPSDAAIQHLAAENAIFDENGYKKIRTISKTLQGELYKAMKYDPSATNSNPIYVAIKRTNKSLFRQRITIERGTNLCVSENVIKEALILRYLTVNHTPIGDYIVKYIDFFESCTDYYLVVEYVESEMNLKQFISKAREYIEKGLLSAKAAQKMMKYILWQLFVTIQWIHTMHCCHLDLCAENILLSNATFIRSANGVRINPKISIKLCDFGVAEVFKWFPSNKSTKNTKLAEHNIFLCEKIGLNIDNENYYAPKVFNNSKFDARCADNWCLGMILFECMTIGQRLYSAQSMYCIKSGYWYLFQNKLREYLVSHKLLQYFSPDSFSLLNALLNVDEKLRLKGITILKHAWFKIYFGRYKKQIMKKFYPQKQSLLRRQNELNQMRFMFYK